MGKVITIDPITRLEGHGKISIMLDDNGNVERAFLQVPELRGFEAFSVGRRAEEMPQITSRICGVCPTAHHMAGTKALDPLFDVIPTMTSKLIRELFYSLFMFEDHLIHFYFLGGPDFIVGPGAPAANRNILGVIDKVGIEIGKKVIATRRRTRELMMQIGGKPIHPVLGLPGGVSKKISKELQKDLISFSKEAIDFAQFTLKAFNEMVLQNKAYLDLISSKIYYHETNYMGMVDKNNHVNFYDGKIRIVDPEGTELYKYDIKDYDKILAEHVEPWTYIKFPYLRELGWKGFIDGKESGLLRVAPLGRLNVADGMATPLAQSEYEKLYSMLPKPCHHTLVNHWARLIEVLYAAERIEEISKIKELLSPEIRNMDLKIPKKGVGVVEAPRGTLIHHYETDDNGIITSANLLVATLFNSAAMCMSIERVAKEIIKNGVVKEGLLNMVEMAFRAYDPCLSCATHSLPGKMPLEISLYDRSKKLIRKISR